MTRLAPAVRKTLEQHDVLFSVGADLFMLSLPSDVVPVPADLTIIHLDTDPWELGKNYPAAAAILGDAKATLPDITAAVRARMNGAMLARARERLDAASKAIAAERAALVAKARSLTNKSPIEPLALLHAIGETLPADAVVVEEALSSGPGLRDLIKSNDPQSFYGLRGGGIGWGLPAAIGVQFALPDRPVVALLGDGSAMYTIQGLWTAAHHRLNVIFIIFNNSSYRILKQRVHAMRGHAAQTDIYVGMELTQPMIDFVALSRSLGVAAERAATVHEATDLLRKGLKDGGPLLIDAVIERSHKPM